MSEFQQVGATDAKLPGQLRSGDALSDAAKDLHQPNAVMLRALQGCAGEDVEAPAALVAAVLEDWFASADMDGALIEAMAVRTPKASAVKEIGQEVVALLGIQQIVEREIEQR